MQEVRTCYQFIFIAFMAELVDATVSKAADRNIMKEINIKYSEYLIDVLLSTDNTSIIDSYRIKRINDMVNVLKKIRNTCDNSYAIHKRSIFGMVNEWRVHNLLYFLHIKRKRTCTVDLNINQSILVKIAYTLLSIFYF